MIFKVTNPKKFIWPENKQYKQEIYINNDEILEKQIKKKLIKWDSPPSVNEVWVFKKTQDLTPANIPYPQKNIKYKFKYQVDYNSYYKNPQIVLE
jgi:hypothetical protein